MEALVVPQIFGAKNTILLKQNIIRIHARVQRCKILICFNRFYFTFIFNADIVYTTSSLNIFHRNWLSLTALMTMTYVNLAISKWLAQLWQVF